MKLHSAKELTLILYQQRCFFRSLKAKSSRLSLTTTYDIIKPEPVYYKTSRSVPKDIPRPNHIYGLENDYQNRSLIKSPWQLEGVRMACQKARNVIDTVAEYIKVGTTTDTLDKYVHETCIALRCYPAPLKYDGFPKSCCTSVNNIVVHGIPDSRALKINDILKIDVSVYYNGFFGDVSETFIVGSELEDNHDQDAHYLVNHARRCRDLAVAVCRPKQRLSMIGQVCEEYVKKHGLTIVKPACGHGIGEQLHEPPQILHYLDLNDEQMKLEMCEGMILAIEPVVCEGTGEVELCEDDIQVKTVDHSRCAQFEHTVAITADGHEILTEGKSDMKKNTFDQNKIFR
ncbi:unnamed protein product [Didymodactylos carnosus]|uniref:Methionine aminopeptidase n=1 Tax=Didymodactylos carnosus TaxID=1234261 RepID=A0A8S2UF57_9BILA|nr:unnamed protein product [Didymodactylos carnosus]CAF4311461.1 unnamed protein product [Didymodactylos carnosus]